MMQFRGNATLRHEEWERYSDRLVQVARDRLNGVMDLRNLGLVEDLGGIGTTLSFYERSGDFTAASISVEGSVVSERDRLTFDEVGIPVPIIRKDWTIGMRQLEASRTRGMPLSTDTMAVAARIVMDALEDMLFNGNAAIDLSGNKIYGYTTLPARETVTFAKAWTDAAATIIKDVENMLAKAYANNMFGPFYVYVAKNLWATIQQDYSTEKSEATYYERIRSFVDIMEVKPGDKLADNNVVLVQMTSDVVDLAVGTDMRNEEWGNEPMVLNYATYTIAAPRVKSDKDGRCGIVHGKT